MRSNPQQHLFLPYKEEVAGSNPASPTSKNAVLQGKRSHNKGLRQCRSPLCSNADLLRESCLHSPHSLVPHARQVVRVVPSVMAMVACPFS